MFESISQSIKEYLTDKNVSENDIEKLYKPKINCFKNYLFKKLKFPNNYDGLQKIKRLQINYLFESMKYYIEQSRKSSNKKHHILKAGTFDDYSFVIKYYFEFLNNSNIPKSIW